MNPLTMHALKYKKSTRSKEGAREDDYSMREKRDKESLALITTTGAPKEETIVHPVLIALVLKKKDNSIDFVRRILKTVPEWTPELGDLHLSISKEL